MTGEMGVYKAIVAIASDMAREGIAKTRQNVQQGYRFRGIDEVLNALAPCLVKHGLVILPRCIGRVVTERTSKTGGVLIYVVVEVEFDFVAVADGSKHTVKTYGEAMDSGDKATNKAMSAAYKYAAFQAFCIPTEGDNDADAVTHELVGKPENESTPAEKPPAGGQETRRHTPSTDKTPQSRGQSSKISPQQVNRINALSKGAGMSDADYHDWLKSEFNYAHTEDIAVEFATQIIEELKKKGQEK